MPYKDPLKQIEYQRLWVARRRAEWFEANGPCEQCGSEDDLQLDHRDPDKKVSHRIWSWATSRREEELAKCRVLCGDCHKEKSNTEKARGESHGRARFTAEQVVEIRALVEQGARPIDVANQFGVSRKTIYELVHRTWKWI